MTSSLRVVGVVDGLQVWLLFGQKLPKPLIPVPVPVPVPVLVL
jgi:hypothetical protein